MSFKLVRNHVGNDGAFRHFGGVPVTVDNLNAGVVQADWFVPEINPKLEKFARFYGTVILPTMPAMPRQECLVASNSENLLLKLGFQACAHFWGFEYIVGPQTA